MHPQLLILHCDSIDSQDEPAGHLSFNSQTWIVFDFITSLYPSEQESQFMSEFLVHFTPTAGFPFSQLHTFVKHKFEGLS